MEMANMSKQLEMIAKALHQGQAFQLPISNSIPDWALRGWKEKFVASLEPLEKEKIQKFRYMWRAEDSEMGDGPKQSIPGSLVEFKWLFNEYRITRREVLEATDIKEANLTKFLELATFCPVAIKADEVLKITAVAASEAEERRTAD